MKINTKLLLTILTSSILIYIIVLGYISIKSKNISFQNTADIIDSYTNQYAKLAETNIDSNINIINFLGQSFENFKEIPDTLRRDFYNNQMKSLLATNNELLSIWCNWEPNSIDNFDTSYVSKPGSTVLGNFKPVYYKLNGEIKLNLFVEQSPETIYDDDIYIQLQNDLKKTITKPYFHSNTGIKQNEILQTKAVVPIIVNDNFQGIAGINFSFTQIQKLFNDFKHFDNSYLFLIDNNGNFVIHPNKKHIRKSIKKSFPEYSKKHDLIKKINEKRKFSFVNKNEHESVYVSVVPFTIGNTNITWATGIVIPLKFITQKSNKTLLITALIGIIGLLFIAFVIFYVAYKISRPLISITELLKTLAKGNISAKKVKIKSDDEIKEIAESISHLIDGLDRTTDFATQIGKGNFDIEFTSLSEDDMLGNSLIEMQKNLQKAKEEENKRKEEENIQKWITQGITKIGEVLRQSSNIKSLCSDIICHLISYLNANQGCVYIINDNEKNDIYLENIAVLGYEDNSIIKKRYNLGEGLMGRCAFEKQTIYRIDIPKDYVKIVSGLGSSLPGSILLVPLILNNEILGVIEIDSFSHLKPHHIEFVEKISENIASTINSVKVSEKTTQLLEQSQQQGEELAAQEEEMRQNMEEMQATQEEATKREDEINNFINAINSNSLVAEYDMEGKLIQINQIFLDLLDIPEGQVIGTYFGSIGTPTVSMNSDLQDIWSDLRTGKSRKITYKLIINKIEIILTEVCSPVFDDEGNPFKIMSIAADITNINIDKEQLNIIN
ncbi:MAG: GAF domain-containing protein [Bacteroidales bacterium]|nr:GAF domain-containing protein [Bacteroidales bacterium]